MPLKNKSQVYDALLTWKSLNAVLKEATLADCAKLMEEEKRNKRRLSFLKRIRSRLDTLRGSAECAELEELCRPLTKKKPKK
jgi:hypothetical protein